MFTLSKIHSELPFLSRIDAGVVTFSPEIKYCQIMYDSHFYQDALFNQFAIPFPEFLNKAPVKRRTEYVAARYAAKLLLEDEGCYDNVGSNLSRAPIWPTGFCGSISHSGNFSIASIAPRTTTLTLGIDIEMLGSKSIVRAADIFCTPVEQTLLSSCHIAYETALLIAFSAKESLFKALFPEANNSFGFKSSRIRQLDISACRITLELIQTLTPTQTNGSLFYGYFSLQDNKVITLIIQNTI